MRFRHPTFAVTLVLMAAAMQALAVPGVPCPEMVAGMNRAAMLPMPEHHHAMPATEHAGDGMLTTPGDHHAMHGAEHGSAGSPSDSAGCCGHLDCEGGSCLTISTAVPASGWSCLCACPLGVDAPRQFAKLAGHGVPLYRPPASCSC